MPQPPEKRTTRRRILLIFAGGSFLCLALLGYLVRERNPAIPGEYQAIRLGMTSEEVDAVLASGRFRMPLGGPGFTGWQKDEQMTPECSELRWSDSAKWHQLFRNHMLRDDDWSMTIVFDTNSKVAGKTLVQIDHGDGTFFRDPVLWFRRKFSGPIP